MPKRKSTCGEPLSARRGVQLLAHSDPVRCLLNHDHGNEEAPKYVNKLQQLVRRGAASKTPVQCTASRPSTASQPVLMRAFRPPPVPKRPRSRPAVTPNIHRPGYTGDLHQPTPHANNDILEITRDDDSDSCISDGERRSYEFEIRRLQRELRAETTRANALQKQTASLLDELKMQGRFETLQSKVYIGE